MMILNTNRSFGRTESREWLSRFQEEEEEEEEEEAK